MNTTDEKVDRREKWELDKEWETCSERTHIFFLPELHHLETKLLLVIFVFFFKCLDLWLEFLHSTSCHHRFVLWYKENKSHQYCQENDSKPEGMTWEKCYNTDKKIENRCIKSCGNKRSKESLFLGYDSNIAHLTS